MPRIDDYYIGYSFDNSSGFPSPFENFARRYKVEFDHTKLSWNGPLNYMEIFVRLDDMPSNFWSTVATTDGRDIWAADKDNNRLPIYVNKIDFLSNTGYVTILFEGTVNGTTLPYIYIYTGWAGAPTEPVNGTYGRNTVYKYYEAFYDGEIVLTSGVDTVPDLTGNGHNISESNNAAGDITSWGQGLAYRGLSSYDGLFRASFESVIGDYNDITFEYYGEIGKPQRISSNSSHYAGLIGRGYLQGSSNGAGIWVLWQSANSGVVQISGQIRKYVSGVNTSDNIYTTGLAYPANHVIQYSIDRDSTSGLQLTVDGERVAWHNATPYDGIDMSAYNNKFTIQTRYAYTNGLLEYPNNGNMILSGVRRSFVAERMNSWKYNMLENYTNFVTITEA